ncbi:protein FAR1-RELATED SEQUENCE 11-like isoform X2 [Rutidosis leptorrhynchoides]|uniref:protein FAR1-RELATED SEQUENCE 11-like isoform X2 n=1 Tax=Rutidosis leptorrhynchoides TaxID=125765 RepID=UPI003A99A31B
MCCPYQITAQNLTFQFSPQSQYPFLFPSFYMNYGVNNYPLSPINSTTNSSFSQQSIRHNILPVPSNFQEAFVFYESYAKQNGFVVRKDRSEKKNDRILRRDINCHRAGKKRSKSFNVSKHQRTRESIKCGCKAHIRITFKRSFDIFPEEWHITKFVKEHNHELLSPEAMRFLPVNRTITLEDEKQILLFKDAGLNVRQIIRVMELQKQYVYTLDEKGRLENLFWCHPQSYEWYGKYGDVVVFDTTYKVNAYDMPCALFVGINNYGKTVLFGSALLRNETTDTFRWLMKTFVTTMKKSSKTIITDQDKCMSEAIAIEMPTTKHSYCIWHITSKFSCWFTALLRTEYQNWCSDFYKLYRMTSIEEFEDNWFLTVDKYNLQKNKHVQGLYELRKSWAPAYLRNYFFGGMTSTQRSESINGVIKRFVSSHTSLRDFVKQVDLVVEEMRSRQVHDNMLATLRPTSLKTKSPLEKQAHDVLTPFAFKKFQEELERASQYLIEHSDGNQFIIRYFEQGNHKFHSVFWDGDTALCSCKTFEFWGILCRHIFRALIHKDCFMLSHVYLPRR